MDMIEAAKQIRKLIEITAGNLTDEQAAAMPYCFPEWKEGIEVKEGERYAVHNIATYARITQDSEETKTAEISLFKCKYAHTTTLEKTPEESPELWSAL